MIDRLLVVAGEPGTDYTMFLQYGAIGAIAVLGIVFARGAHKRETDRSDRLEDENRRLNEENRRLNEAIQERVIPAMIAATSAAQESARLLAALQRDREIERLTVDHERRRRGDNV